MSRLMWLRPLFLAPFVFIGQMRERWRRLFPAHRPCAEFRGWTDAEWEALSARRRRLVERGCCRGCGWHENMHREARHARD